jgi:hypothetical protein
MILRGIRGSNDVKIILGAFFKIYHLDSLFNGGLAKDTISTKLPKFNSNVKKFKMFIKIG